VAASAFNAKCADASGHFAAMIVNNIAAKCPLEARIDGDGS
jgi:hypothetical protein